MKKSITNFYFLKTYFMEGQWFFWFSLAIKTTINCGESTNFLHFYWIIIRQCQNPLKKNHISIPLIKNKKFMMDEMT